MERKKRLDEIHLQILDLKDRFKELGLKLAQEGERLKNPGYPPDPLVLQDAAEQADRFKLLSQKLKMVAEDLSWTGLNGRINSLYKMEELWQGLAGSLTYLCVLEEQNRQSLVILKRGMGVSLPGNKSSAELDYFRERVRYYEEILSRDLEDAEAAELRRQLLAGVHPLNALLRLAEEYLEPEEADHLFQLSAQEFGTMLTIAATRGGLVLPPSADEESGGVTGEKAGKIDFLRNREDKQERVLLHEVKMKLESPARREQDPIKRLSEQIFNLLKEEKLGPAFWLSCYCEQKYGHAPFPSWLIKAVDVADVIEGNGGPAEAWLSYIYSNHDFRSLLQEEPQEEKRMALALLTFASLLKPAVVAPESGAPMLIEQLEGLRRGSDGNNDDVLDKKFQNLSHEAFSLQKPNRKLSLASPLALKLWEKMQEEKGLIHKLLNPIKTNDERMLDEVGNLVYYLMKEDNLNKEVAKLYCDMQKMEGPLELFQIPSSWQVLARLREAIKLAERWLTLHESIGTDSHRRDELGRHLLPSGDELEEMIRQYGNEGPLSAVIPLYKGAFEFLERSLLMEIEIASAEDITALELSKDPQLKLKPSWIPKAETVEKMGGALLELLNKEEIDAEKMDYGYTELAETKGDGYHNLKEDYADGSDNNSNLWQKRKILSPQESDYIMETLKNLHRGGSGS